MISCDAVQWFDKGFGPHMVPVTPPECDLAPGSSIRAKDRGKAPGKLVHAGWVGVSVNDPAERCHNYNVAKTWRDVWGANTGFVLGDGYIVFDNDQGKLFSTILSGLLKNPLRRFVADPKWDRDAFFVRIVDADGKPVSIRNHKLKFTHTTGHKAEVEIVAHNRQFVIGGVHPGAKANYVWSREIESIAEVPEISLTLFNGIVEEFLYSAHENGWVSSADTAPVSAPASIPSTHQAQFGHSSQNNSRLAEAVSLLAEIPNRDAPTGQENHIDRWLDDYDNKVKVAYAFASHMAPNERDPAVKTVWLDWGNGRAQRDPDAVEAMWDSAIRANRRSGPTALIKLVRSLVAPRPDFPDLDPADPALQSETPVWDKLRNRWVFSAKQGFIDTLTGEPYGVQAFANMHARIAMALKRELAPRAKGAPNAANLFLRQRDMVEVFDVTYAPGDPTLVLSPDPLKKTFNRWKATTALGRIVSEAQIKPWLDHLLFVLGSLDERNRFLRWCAFIVQRPHLKPQWHYLVMSLPGLGKDTMMMPIKLAVGAGNFYEMLSEMLAQNFHYHLEHKLLIIGETHQPKWGSGVTSHDLNNRTKPLLASPPDTLTINKKNQTPYEIPNRHAVIFFSNDKNPLYLERGSRRVHVVNRMSGKTQKIDYYLNLRTWLDAGGAELAAAFLLTYPLSAVEANEFAAGVAPETDDKLELESQNVEPQLAELEDLIQDARDGVAENAPVNLVDTAGGLAGYINLRTKKLPSPRTVSGWLLDMERRGTGVRRLARDPKNPNACGAVTNNKGLSGRLWLLADKTADGRDWTTLTHTEIVAIWRNLPPPKNAPVHQLHGGKSEFPDDGEGEPV